MALVKEVTRQPQNVQDLCASAWTLDVIAAYGTSK